MTGRFADEDGFFTIDEEALKRGERVFRSESRFVAGADTAARIPDSDLPEVAFAGRSNVGKSTLINALTGRKSLARASNTPGRTQQINFFDLGGMMQLADLPGYGYAKVVRSKKHQWNDMVRHYLAGRRNLVRLCVLVDGRHGILEADEKALRIIDDAGVAYIVVLTKVDKVKKGELDAVRESVELYLRKCKGAFPRVHATSADKGTGIPELRAILSAV
jgi:GTP-binding protein